MKDIRAKMPVMARHEGSWEGSYIYVNLSGAIVDRHKAELFCTFPSEGAYPYYQINRYTWDDGRFEEIHFPGIYNNNRVWFDNERIKGSIWEIDRRSLVLTWTRKDIPGSYLYELVQLSSDNNHRTRTWHWFKEDSCFQRTLIQETRVSSKGST